MCDKILGLKIKNLQHYVIPPLEEEKPDIAVIHIGSNNVTYNNLDNDSTVIAKQIGERCIEYGMKDIVTSSIFVKHSVKLSAFIRKINDELRELCVMHNCSFVSNDNALRKHLCGDGVHLNLSGTYILAGNRTLYVRQGLISKRLTKFES